MANVVFVGGRDWLLVDAGMPANAGTILGAARQLCGPLPRPSAIIVTHGHPAGPAGRWRIDEPGVVRVPPVGHRPRPACPPVPDDGSVPGLDGWRWLHTPGHAPGHVSLFRDADRTLVAGDAVTTVKQESLLAVMAQILSLPPDPLPKVLRALLAASAATAAAVM